jgi:hypothetical protein
MIDEIYNDIGGAHKPNSYDFGGGIVNAFSFYESESK